MRKSERVLRFLSAVLAVILSIGVLDCISVEAAEIEIIVNDSEVGTVPFTFEFSNGWVHEGGYPDRFEGGDEHWTTTAQFGESYPTVTFRFVGTRVALYGHKVPVGAKAEVVLDGKEKGYIDFYNPSRVERTLLFQSEAVAYGEHTLKVQLIAGKNPLAGDSHEASIDYAVVRTKEVLPVTAVKANTDAVTLEAGMNFVAEYTLFPSYATESAVMTFISSAPDVAEVGKDGTVVAKKPGTAEITIAPADGAYKDIVEVTVRESIGGDLVVMASTTNRHTSSDDYYEIFTTLELSDTGLSAVAWRNDIAAVKLDVLTKGKNVDNIAVQSSSLVNKEGDVLNADITCSFIKETCAHDSGHNIPDVIYTEDPVGLPAKSVASVWISIKTPADALPGLYSGEMIVTADPGVKLTIPLNLEVIGLNRPENTAALELWQYPYSSNRYYSGKTTAEYFGAGKEGIYRTRLNAAYMEALRTQVELYAEAGGKVITVTIVEDPWNSQTPDPYPSMIKWTRQADGRFAFDYTDFDKWVELNDTCGVDGPIFSFSISDWANNITYYDELSKQVRVETLNPGSSRWKEIWRQFLTDYMAHTTEKGWFDRVYMAMDERPANVVKAVLDLVESVRNERGECFHTSLAVFSFETEHLFDRITDLSLAIQLQANKLKAITAHRRELGLVTTLYACGGQYNALENSPYESLYTMWYCEKIGADGFLRWALDAFNADPLTSSDHRLYAAGDIYLIYPDDRNAAVPQANSSVRFEKLAEGCRDITKFRYLKANFPEWAEILEQMISTFGRKGDLEQEALRMQSEMADIARLAAVKQLLVECEAITERSDALNAAMAGARILLEVDQAAAEELQGAAYKMAKLSAEEKAPDINPSESQGSEKRLSFDIGWALAAGAAIAALTVAAVVLLRRKR